MAAWREENTAKTIARLRCSLDLTYLKRWLITLLAAFALLLIFALFDRDSWLFHLIVAGTVLLPAVLYFLWRIRRIFKCAESYSFCRARLRKPRFNTFSNTVYFAVIVEDMEGRKFVKDTSAIFHAAGIMSPTMAEYSDTTVTIGYNEKTGNIVVCN